MSKIRNRKTSNLQRSTRARRRHPNKEIAPLRSKGISVNEQVFQIQKMNWKG